MISIPEDTIVYEWPASKTWYDQAGVLFSVYIKGAKRSLEETKTTIEGLKNMTGEKKVCMLVDVSDASESSREIRNYASEEIPKFIKAMAIVSASPVGRMLGNLFLTLKTQTYPTRLFSNETEARLWLDQYL
jgi:hypothetical protein